MPRVVESPVSFRVCGDDLDPGQVTALLGCAPTRAHAKGEQIVTRSRPVTARTGGWLLVSHEADTEDLDSRILGLLARLPVDPAVWAQLSARFRLDMFVGLYLASFNEGIELRPETLRAMGERGIVLGLDIYSVVD
jgi:hypothetical protein